MIFIFVRILFTQKTFFFQMPTIKYEYLLCSKKKSNYFIFQHKLFFRSKLEKNISPNTSEANNFILIFTSPFLLFLKFLADTQVLFNHSFFYLFFSFQLPYNN